MKVAPSILSADFSILREEIIKLETNNIEYLHLDIMDGTYVPNITIGQPVIKSLRSISKMIFDVHLMIERPDLHIESFAKSGADIITIHPETVKHLHRTIFQIKSLGLKAGISLNPTDSLDILEYILPELDVVLIMTVNPGYGGQKFIKSQLKKIEKLRKIIDNNNYHTKISVDGGVNSDTVKDLKKVGVDIIVTGSFLFNFKDIREGLEELGCG